MSYDVDCGFFVTYRNSVLHWGHRMFVESTCITSDGGILYPHFGQGQVRSKLGFPLNLGIAIRVSA